MIRTLLTIGLCIGAVPLAAQETRFTKELRPGQRMEISNINGAVSVTQASGSTAEVVVRKTVKRGNGDLVKAIMEERNGGIHVCTIYLNQDPNRTTCAGNNSMDRRRGDDFEVTMSYEVRVPAGVQFEGTTVNGGVEVRGLQTPATVTTVNGSIEFDGVGAHRLTTVNGAINATFRRADWSGTTALETVNGAITLTLPANADMDIRGSMVNGRVNSDFPVTMRGRWGPKQFNGTIGNGGRSLALETVNGAITLRKR